MSWFSKKLKKVTNVIDPVGKYLRKSTGGSYGDPMNWYNSKPNTTQPWQPKQSPGLIAPPSGPAPQGQTFGQNTGGYNYMPNRFAQPSGAMSFGGGQPATPPMQQQQQPMQGPRDAMAQQQQMARIGAVRGSYV